MEAVVQYLPYLVFLACPVSMIGGMWIMGRAMRPASPTIRTQDEVAAGAPAEAVISSAMTAGGVARS